MRTLSNILSWVTAVSRAWVGWVGGSAIAVFMGIGQAAGLWNPKPQHYAWLMIVGIVVSMFQAWQQERDSAAEWKSQAEAARVKRELPDFKGRIERFMMAPAGDKAEHTILTVLAVITNSGGPSIANNFSGAFKNEHGVSVRTQAIPPPRERLTLYGHGGESLTWTADQYLPSRATVTPIPTGGQADGFIQMVVPNTTVAEVSRGTVGIAFSDVHGNRHTIEQKLTDSTPSEIIDPNKLQKHTGKHLKRSR